MGLVAQQLVRCVSPSLPLPDWGCSVREPRWTAKAFLYPLTRSHSPWTSDSTDPVLSLGRLPSHAVLCPEDQEVPTSLNSGWRDVCKRSEGEREFLGTQQGTSTGPLRWVSTSKPAACEDGSEADGGGRGGGFKSQSSRTRASGCGQ